MSCRVSAALDARMLSLGVPLIHLPHDAISVE
jgi:hypothetical protein